MINLTEITKTYQLGTQLVPVLKKINLTIEDGDFLTIMGPSGSGKSTLMNIIGCLDKPTSGMFLLNGQDITRYQDVQLSKIRNESIGFVFQQFQLLPRLTALKNVELPMIYAGVKKKERRERAVEMLTKVGLADRIEHLPNSLSGGQKQRVAIARALVNEPHIILADEPTGALDTKTSSSIMELLVTLNHEGTTIVVVTHEPEVAEYSKKTIVVRDGEIVNVKERRKGSNDNERN
ncbi:ABC transporter ATP-binding protein [Bacillus alkalicellulosilyticus]|uniref:ABC transporter ATP-binding protein n=1 Tax=Alkalihalobacterium alkalicellulosilyticum TaxID=1912214 RepID=UPI0009986573|nr:ABC transporter ATP-binding protein [Bacillus alkalicellulosilyticus]